MDRPADPKAQPVEVPFEADPVLSPVVRHATGGWPDEPEFSTIIVPLKDDRLGRVTFETLDSLRVSRGELAPFPKESWERGDWVYTVQDSAWLAERHVYEWKHYQTPLLEDYQHYLFEFHDEFVEAIAKGIWLDLPDPSRMGSLPSDHPLVDMPSNWMVNREDSFGVVWELLKNPAAQEVLVHGSRLCSQKLYQFNLVFEGRSSASAAVRVRTTAGSTTTSLVRPWAGVSASWTDVPDLADIMPAWLRYVSEVAERRRAKGKT
jgi:hypothetical protein